MNFYAVFSSLSNSYYTFFLKLIGILKYPIDDLVKKLVWCFSTSHWIFLGASNQVKYYVFHLDDNIQEYSLNEAQRLIDQIKKSGIRIGVKTSLTHFIIQLFYSL